MVTKHTSPISDKAESLLQQFEMHFEFNQLDNVAKRQLRQRTQK